MSWKDLKSTNDASSQKEEQDRFSAFTEWNPHPIIELDSALNITYTNEAARIQFPDLLVSHNAKPFIKELEKNVDELLQLKSELVVFEREVSINGKIYEEQLFSIPKHKRIYIFMTDLSKRKQAEQERLVVEEQLFQAQKMEAIGQLTGGLAHDFNNILTVIQGNLDLLKMETTDEKQIKRITSALEATMRGASLSRQLLSFARKEPLKSIVINLHEQIQEILRLLKPTLGESIDVEVKLDDVLWDIYVDPNQFINAILNLAVNARDAMSGKGKLTITMSNTVLSKVTFMKNYKVFPGNYVKICVGDSGSGIPVNILDRIFEPFFTTKGVGKGTGLGLSQVYGFITQTKGAITVDSEVNKGTTINMYIPRATVAQSQEMLEKDSLENQGPAKLPTEKILIVEDNDSIRQMTFDYLTQLGYPVIQAQDGQTALMRLKENPDIKLIFSDVILTGDSTGPKLIQEVIKIRPDIKVLLTSGYTKNAIDEKSNYKLIGKPYKLEELAKEIRNILEQ